MGRLCPSPKLGVRTAMLYRGLLFVACTLGAEGRLRSSSPPFLPLDGWGGLTGDSATPSTAVSTTTTAAITTAATTTTSPEIVPTFHWLHIGKNAGSTIHAGLRDYIAHDPHTNAPRIILHNHGDAIAFVKRRFVEKRPLPQDAGRVFFWLRAPVHRYTSGWISRYRQGLPHWHVPWTTVERVAYTTFQTADDLGCALGSMNPIRRAMAASAFGSVQHVSDPLAKYLQGVKTVSDMRDAIAFVGRVEHFEEDWTAMVNMLVSAGALTQVPPFPAKQHETPAKYEKFKSLGKCSVDNLRSWYAEDYKIIQKLASLGLISSDYPGEVDVLDKAPPMGLMKSYF